MDRNPNSDLEADATSGLEELAASISQHVTPGRGSAASLLSIFILTDVERSS